MVAGLERENQALRQQLLSRLTPSNEDAVGASVGASLTGLTEEVKALSAMLRTSRHPTGVGASGAAHVQSAHNPPPEPSKNQTLLVGDSLLRDVDESRLVNTVVICKPGGKIKDAREAISSIDRDFKRVVCCVGTVQMLLSPLTPSQQT
jgi:hypothetical protein